jgi:hypothetical protein
MPLGLCHICGTHTELTFEHVPPRAAFNSRPITNTPFQKLLEASDLDDPDIYKGKQSQKGAGAHTLCRSCNNNSGAWYGDAFVHWSYQGLEMLGRAQIAPSLAYIFQIFPLRVIKQILCMFFSANPPGSLIDREELVRFVLNRQWKYLNPRVGVYAALSDSPRARQAGVSGLATIGSSANVRVYSEIAFPPLTYVLTLDSDPPDPRLVDISFFSHFSYNDWKDVTLRLPILPVYSMFPGDYRSRDQTLLDVQRNIEQRDRLIR